MKNFKNLFNATWLGIYEVFLFLKIFWFITIPVVALAIYFGHETILLIILFIFIIIKIADSKTGIENDEYDLEAIMPNRIKKMYRKSGRFSKENRNENVLNFDKDIFPTIYNLNEKSILKYSNSTMIILNNPRFLEKNIDEVNIEYRDNSLFFTFFKDCEFKSSATIPNVQSITENDILNLI
ncbi:hypothetical protein [Clostridium thermobutyricum]|uniref:hypothetical protein n=1 Tax=Clostridium thermobutyricum TaxID=29372 RepID=UPI0018AC7445|nr:hypothetical protein [Clostridium thermobutyricum]